MSESTLHTKYRPSKALAEVFGFDSGLDLIIGQDDTVRSLKSTLQKPNKPHVILLIGPPGTGKTTTARCVAEEIGCTDGVDSIHEIDIPSYGGVDAIRKLTEESGWLPFGGAEAKKMYILDEVQALSKEGFSALLKSLEEPPEHVYYALATTDPAKIPKAILSRCTKYVLNSVPTQKIIEWLNIVAGLESIELDPQIIEMCATSSNGCVREALVKLGQVQDFDSVEQAARVLGTYNSNEDPNSPFSQVCQMLMRREKSWNAYKPFVQKFTGGEITSFRTRIMGYLAAVLNRADDNEFRRLMPLCDYVSQLPAFPTEAEGLFAIQLLIGQMGL